MRQSKYHRDIPNDTPIRRTTMATNNLMNKLEAAACDIADLDKHIEVQEPLKHLVQKWAYESKIMNIEQEDYDYLVNLITKWILKEDSK